MKNCKIKSTMLLCFNTSLISDLAEYANEFLIASINDGDVEAFNDYRRLVPYNCLKETTIRAVVLALVQFGRIREAEFCVESLFQHTYSLPLVSKLKHLPFLYFSLNLNLNFSGQHPADYFDFTVVLDGRRNVRRCKRAI